MSDVRVEVTLNAKPGHAYSAFTNELMLVNWLANDAKNDVRVNGFYHLYFTEGVIAAGIFKAVEADKRLTFSWFATGDPGETEVEITFEAAGDSTKVAIVQRGYGSGEAWEKAQAGNQSNWESCVSNLQYYFTHGLDRRVMMRPMLGILPGGLDDARRESHGLQHVPHGVFLTSIVPGGGADKSGLLANDVIIGLEGAVINDFYDMDRVIRRHQAGDTVNAELWRGKDKMEVELTFGQRPVPQLAQKPAELAAQIREKVDTIKQELSEILDGIPEDVMEHKPSATEWSLKEQLAHLIVAERANSYYDWILINGESAYPYGANDAVHLALGACGHDTGAALFAELKQTLDENAAVAAAVSETVAENRALFLTMAHVLTFTGDHVRTHYAQMHATIESARAAVPA